MRALSVALGERTYPILIQRDHFHRLGRALTSRGLGPLGIVITNRTARRLAGAAVIRSLTAAGWRVSVIEIPDTERAKSPAVALRVLRTVARRSPRETPVLLALGGGVVGDLTGYVASQFRRGVPYVQLPTTLLAQVDSAIGGKVGIDLPEGKNLAGAFYQPRAVYSDITVLRTLPPRQLRSGLSEVIKYAAIADTTLWHRLERRRLAIVRGDPRELTWIVERCARIKARLVSVDEREARSRRTWLNFGHTVGHALEAACGYSARFTHGEAIAIGMAVAADLGCALGVTMLRTRDQLVALLTAFGLPTRTKYASVTRIEQAMMFDKKFISGTQRWVFVQRIGRALVANRVPPALVRDVMRSRIGGSA